MPAYLPIVSKFDPKGLNQAESGLKNFGKMAAGIAAAATAAVAGIAIASVKEFSKFDDALNKSLAIMDDVSQELRTGMSDAAREVAKTTSFSAEQAAESYFFLASAGLDAEQAIAAMPQVAKFAQAGMFDMALATDLATDAQSALGLTVDDAGDNLKNLTRVTDVFVAANTLANTSVEQLATAFTTKAGNALKTVGKDIEEGAAALAVFADQGIKGERAGTLLTNTIFGFTDVMKKAPDVAKELGLSIFDSAGEMKSFADISENLTAILAPMTKEQQIATLSNLGFTKQAREGALALIGQADSLREYEVALNDAGGTAEDVAKKQMVTLSAQMGLLKDELKDVGIEIGSQLAPVLLVLVDSLKPVIRSLGPVLTQAFKSLLPSITSLVEMLPTLVTVFAGILPAIFAVVEIVLKLAEIVLPILVEMFDMLIPVIENLMPFLVTLVDDLVKPLADAFMELVTQLVPLIDKVLPPLLEILDSLVPVFIELVNDAVLPLIPLVMTLVDAFLPLLEMVLPLLASLLSNVIVPIFVRLAQFLTGVLVFAVDAVVSIFQFLSDTFVNVGQFFKDTYENVIQPAIGALGDFFTFLWEKILTPIFDAWLIAFGLIAGVVQLVFENIIQPLLGHFGDFFTHLYNQIVEPLTEQMGFVFEKLGEAWDWVYSNVLEPVIDAFGAGFEWVYNNLIKPVADLIGGAFETVGDTTETVFGSVQSFMEDTFKNLVNIVRVPLNTIIGFINNVIDALNTIQVTIPPFVPKFGGKTFGINLPRISEIPALADGGIVMPRAGGVLAQLAEGGRPEAVIPLDRMGDFGGNTYQITINAGVGSDPVSIGRYVADAIKRYESVSGKVFVSA
jgi:TP901 family phage tail tape measure protein